ncbi:hypothetical protein [Haloferax sp. DFSO52]|uniref:hypothetical protein n=1 Tax=Haloferax sp. DFSO52 TaxID=3388505 RepID=UPI003A881854
MTPEKIHAPPHGNSGSGEYSSTNLTGNQTTNNRLSLFVVTADEHVSTTGDFLDPLSDIAWLQFIDGIDMFVLVGNERDVLDTSARDCEVPDSGLWLVDEAGTVRRQWSLPSERREVLSIGRSVESTLHEWGDAR